MNVTGDPVSLVPSNIFPVIVTGYIFYCTSDIETNGSQTVPGQCLLGSIISSPVSPGLSYKETFFRTAVCTAQKWK
jgi:hypothetical protein